MALHLPHTGRRHKAACRQPLRLAVLVGLWVACVAANVAKAGPLLEVDLELILAVDVSRSMDANENQLQREGYVAAFQSHDVVRAIESGPFGRIAVVYFEWAGPEHQSVAVPWTIVNGRDDAEAFADKLAGQPILPEAGTSVSASLAFAERLFPASGSQSLRRAVDLSGDGANNDGPPVAPARSRLIAKGVTINGLAIELGGRSEVTAYYERNVIGGPGAFTVTVEDQSKFAEAIRRKLVLEIAWCRPTVTRAVYAPPPLTQPATTTGSGLERLIGRQQQHRDRSGGETFGPRS